jgi:release factor glutamine methyltransferase
MTVQQILQAASERLVPVSSTPRLDAEVLLGLATGLSRSDLLLKLDQELDAPDFESLLARRLTGEPIAYIAGHKEFWGRDFVVSPAVLIPRPDSETLITTTLEAIDSLSHPARLLEIGTGSGCLGLTVLAERPTTTAKLTDISTNALEIAHQNATQLGVTDRTQFATQDLLTGETGRYDILITNLPYVPEHWLARSDEAPETHGLPFEPQVALTGGGDGFVVFRRFLQQFSAKPVAPILILEHGDHQSEELADLVTELLPTAQTTAIADLSGMPRVLRVDLSPKI